MRLEQGDAAMVLLNPSTRLDRMNHWPYQEGGVGHGKDAVADLVLLVHNEGKDNHSLCNIITNYNYINNKYHPRPIHFCNNFLYTN